MLTDSAGNSTTDTIDITLVNKPKLDSGMVPVIYSESAEAWIIADENGGEWYDYSSDEAQWANIMLQDGLTVEGDIEVLDDNKTALVGKEITTSGSMFVWIPRYMYQIPSANYHTSTAGEINIKFLKGTTNIATDETNVEIANASGADNWNVHPAFCDGNKTNYANGEWDKDITGIWVAKFEASSSNPNATYGGGDTADLNVKVLPNVASWRGITANNMFEVCRKMSNNNNIYGISSISDMHIMKNSEWGMVSYLTSSKYGANGRVWSNSNSSYLTGNAGTSENTAQTSNTYSYNTANGMKASTTGNVYGIYDMAGGAAEYTATYLNFEGVNNSAYIINIINAQFKYKSLYKNDETTYGDAIYETPEWFQAGMSALTNDYPLVYRGGSDTTTGISNFRNIFGLGKGSGVSTGGRSFRPVCIVE
ncbi:MAG: hypothetical protein IKP28_00895 [Clostridia bacterium]|nr:hypothetical protein [Clostridia bacterium]